MTFPWLALGAVGIGAVTLAAAHLTRLHAVAAVAGGGCILLLHGWFYFHYTSDDAYISYRYARNLSDGLGLVWNPGEHVEGYSNFLWVLILAALHKQGADIPFCGRWLGFALAVAASAGAYALARDLTAGGRGRMAGVTAVLLLAASGSWALWSVAGLEVPLFALLTLGAVLLHIREHDRPAVPVSGVAWALVAMTRPDGVVLFAVSGVFKLCDALIRTSGTDAQRTAAPARLVSLAVWLAGFALIYVPYFAWRYAEYGWLLPNTYYAKVGTGLDQYDRGLRYAMQFTQEYTAWLLLLVPIAIASTPMRRAPALYVLALLVAWSAYVVYIGGDSLLRFRFFAPLLPLYYPLVAAAGASLLGAVRDAARQPGRLLAATALLAASAMFAVTLQPSADGFGAAEGRAERQAVGDRVDVGRWLRANLPAATAVALVPAGAIPYESRLPTIDMLGITDEHIAHRDIPLGEFPAGHEKYDSEYVLDRRPDIIILFDGLTGHAWTRSDYDALSGVIIPAIIDMVTTPRLFEEYEPRAVELREGKWLNLLVRHGAEPVLAKTLPAP